MGETTHLKLKTISPTDNMPVKNFFQDLAGDVSTSNMQKIDGAVNQTNTEIDKIDPASSVRNAGGMKKWMDLNYEKGKDGGYYSPTVDSYGNLSWEASKLDMPSVPGANIKGQKGDQGNPGNPGENGGYYTPAVSQPSTGSMSISFSGSKIGMPFVNPVSVTLPKGQKGDAGDPGPVFPEISMSSNTATLDPNKLYVWGEIATLNITLGNKIPGRYSEFMFEFKCPKGAATTLGLPSGVKWQIPLKPEAGKHYQVSILNGLGVWTGA